MSKFLLILLLCLSFSCFSQSDDYNTKLIEHRAKTDQHFADTNHSIFPKKMAMEFKHLNYYEPNMKFNVVAKFKKKIGKQFTMTTSSGKQKAFRQYGILSFEIDGKAFNLPIYQNIKLMENPKYKDYIFIPFTDLTNIDETYGGGRYIEASKPTGNTYVLDFNYAFNPYCHYTTGYNCPIPPKANFLDIKIEAGEKLYHTDAH